MYTIQTKNHCIECMKLGANKFQGQQEQLVSGRTDGREFDGRRKRAGLFSRRQRHGKRVSVKVGFAFLVKKIHFFFFFN